MMRKVLVNREAEIRALTRRCFARLGGWGGVTRANSVQGWAAGAGERSEARVGVQDVWI